MEQLERGGDSDCSDEDEGLDLELLQEMEALRGDLNGGDRASLRKTLHQNFHKFVSAQK
jgi:hypothetical protein